MKRYIIILIGGLALSGCSEPEKLTPQQEEERWLANFTASCVDDATDAGSPKALAQQACKCASGKVLDKVGIDATTIPQDTANQIIDQCLKQINSGT